MSVYKKRLIDRHTWLPQLDSNQRPVHFVSRFGYIIRRLRMLIDYNLLICALGCIYGCYKYSAYRAAIVQQFGCRVLIDNICTLGNFKPIFRFVTFFQCYLKFCYKVSLAVGILGFTYVCAYTGAAALELVC